MWPVIPASGTILRTAFFRSRTLLVTVGVITIVALSMSMAVMFI